MKTRLLVCITSLVSLLGLSGCLQVESTISVKKDGSGTITEVILVGEQIKGMLEMAAAQGGGNGKDPMAKMTDKVEAEARAKKMGEGVELVSIEKIDADGKLGVRTVYKFSDINKLTYSADGAVDMAALPGGAAEKAEDTGTSFVMADGKLTIVQKKPDLDKGEKNIGIGEMDPNVFAMMKGLMKDMRITTKVKIEPGIIETDASHVDGNVILLADIQMEKLLDDPEKIKALQTGDFDKAKNALKGVDGIKFEEKEKVTVEMK